MDLDIDLTPYRKINSKINNRPKRKIQNYKNYLRKHRIKLT